MMSRQPPVLCGNVTGPGAEKGRWQILFDGSDLSKWQNDNGGKPSSGWAIEDGVPTRKSKAGIGMHIRFTESSYKIASAGGNFGPPSGCFPFDTNCLAILASLI